MENTKHGTVVGSRYNILNNTLYIVYYVKSKGKTIKAIYSYYYNKL